MVAVEERERTCGEDLARMRELKARLEDKEHDVLALQRATHTPPPPPLCHEKPLCVMFTHGAVEFRRQR